jgi:nucleoid-associated protein YgaU
MKTFLKVGSTAILLMAASACSMSEVSEEGDGMLADDVPVADASNPDAATDAVPQPSAESQALDAMAGGDPAAPPADPAADPNALAPPPADVAATDPPPVDALPPPADAPAQQAAIDVPPPAPVAAAPEPAPAAPAPVASNNDAVEPSPAGSGQFEDYSVQAGDTLMKIAFETYGDLYRWKSILEANRGKISNPSHIPAGTVIKLEKPSSPVSIAKNGEKYLIQNGDTLGTISGDVYGTRSKWKKLWENNRQMIHDPNRIFAGFYLYYQPEEGVTPRPLARHGKKKAPKPDVEVPALPENGGVATNTAQDPNRVPAAAGGAPVNNGAAMVPPPPAPPAPPANNSAGATVVDETPPPPGQ